MLNHKIVGFLTFIFISTLFVSCSTTNTSTTSDNSANAANTGSQYPSWYLTGRSVESNETSYMGYATALAGDSTASVERAVEHAKAELKTAISGKLETIRNDAVVELGSDSGLDRPRFIIALRKAENEVPALAIVEEVTVEKSGEERNGYRSFTKVSIEKEALIEELDKTFSANGKAWRAMKRSEAFEDF